jgi:2-keto-4-pentenoate hydratase
MDTKTAQAAANEIGAAWRAGARLARINPEHDPKNLADAYAIQEQLIKQQSSKSLGWKIGCTNQVAQAQLGVDEPFRGQVPASGVQFSPATVSAGSGFMRVIETELAFRLHADLPDKITPYDQDSVAVAVGEIIPSVEIVDSIWQNWEEVGALHLIADKACHAGLVLGEPSQNWHGMNLALFEVSTQLNDETPLTGRGGHALGHPLNALAWLANNLISAGRCLKADEIVSTGVLTGLIFAESGDRIVADYGTLGAIQVTITD